MVLSTERTGRGAGAIAEAVGSRYQPRYMHGAPLREHSPEHLDRRTTHVDELPYWQQADSTMDEPRRLQARQSLRGHVLIEEAIEMWWRTAHCSAVACDEARLSFGDYETMSHKMYRALIETYDSVDADACCRSDWVRYHLGASDFSPVMPRVRASILARFETPRVAPRSLVRN